MKILHTSDLHFGISVNNVSMLEDQGELVEQLVQIAQQEADAVVIAGDVFDHALSSAQTITLYDTLITQLCMDVKLPVVLCAGNHDGAARLASCSRLLHSAGLYIAGNIAGGLQTVQLGNCDFHLLPWFSTDEVRYLYPEREIGTYGMAFDALADEFRSRFVAGRKNILVAHCFVSGAEVVESDRSITIGGANMLGKSAFAGFDYVALGHLHRAQNLGKAIRYSGSPMKYSFDEAGRQKTVTIYDTESEELKEVPIVLSRDMRVAKGSYEKVLSAAQTDLRSTDYMKIILEDEYAHQKHREIFESYYPNLLMMEGKAYQEGMASTTLTVNEVSKLSASDVMKRFYMEATGGEQPDEKRINWFMQAVRDTQEGDGLQ